MSFSLDGSLSCFHQGMGFIGFLYGATAAEAVLDSVWFIISVLEVIWENAG
jgi:hypothetical protein